MGINDIRCNAVIFTEFSRYSVKISDEWHWVPLG